MDNSKANSQQLASIEVLQRELHNLEETITNLLELMKSSPDGELKNRLFNELGTLDSVADEMRQALNAWCTGGRA